MSEFRIEVVRLGPTEKHPNADSLGITRVHGGYPCIFKLGQFNEGDLAVYVPVDSVVPDLPEWSFLNGKRRVKAVRLRGSFSMGLLVAAPVGTVEGQDVAGVLGITKYEPPAEKIQTSSSLADAAPVGFHLPHYDIEGLRRWPAVIVEGEDVLITEKIHGASSSYCHDRERLWVKSRTQFKRREGDKLWWPIAEQYGLEERLSKYPFMAIYGEVFGNVQDLRYGVKSGAQLRVFDVLDVAARRWLDADDAVRFTEVIGLEWVPILYRGPWNKELWKLAEGKTTVNNADHVREGFVVRPIQERWNSFVGRVQLKAHGEGYLTRKSA